MSIAIRFNGVDFCDIQQCACDAEFIPQCVQYDTDDIKGKILRRFLDEVESDSLLLCINNPDEFGNNETLYNKGDGKGFIADFNQNMFGGVIGVVKKCIHFAQGEFDLSLPETDIDIDVTLQLQTRFDKNDFGNNEQRPYFLLSMIMAMTGIQLSNNDIPSDEAGLFDFLLISLFKKQLSVFSTKGYFRAYQNFYNNDDRIKGSIDIARHIKTNMGMMNGRISYTYRNKSVDNYFNHLILATYTYIKGKYPQLTLDIIDSDQEVYNAIKILGYSIEYPKYDIRTIVNKNLNPIAHPYYIEYEFLRTICLRILRNETAGFFDGTGDSVQGVLFYVPRLWELFVKDLFYKYLHEKNFISQDKNDVFAYNNKESRALTIIPDYVFYENKTPYMILDAKFKPKWGEQVSRHNSISMLRDDYDECIRNMNAFNAHATGVIFPSSIEIDKNDMKHSISEYNTFDAFYTIPLYVPRVENDESFIDWKEKFYKYCQDTICILEDFLDLEKELNAKIYATFQYLALNR